MNGERIEPARKNNRRSKRLVYEPTGRTSDVSNKTGKSRSIPVSGDVPTIPYVRSGGWGWVRVGLPLMEG